MKNEKIIFDENPHYETQALRHADNYVPAALGLYLLYTIFGLVFWCVNAFGAVIPFNAAAAKFGNYADTPLKPSEAAISATADSKSQTGAFLANYENGKAGIAVSASQTSAPAGSRTGLGIMAGAQALKIPFGNLLAGAGASQTESIPSSGARTSSTSAGGAVRVKNSVFDAGVFGNVPVENAKERNITGAADAYFSESLTLSGRVDARKAFAPKFSTGADLLLAREKGKLPQITAQGAVSMQSGKAVQTAFGLRFFRKGAWNLQGTVMHTRNAGGSYAPSLKVGAGCYIR